MNADQHRQTLESVVKDARYCVRIQHYESDDTDHVMELPVKRYPLTDAGYQEAVKYLTGMCNASRKRWDFYNGTITAEVPSIELVQGCGYEVVEQLEAEATARQDRIDAARRLTATQLAENPITLNEVENLTVFKRPGLLRAFELGVRSFGDTLSREEWEEYEILKPMWAAVAPLLRDAVEAQANEIQELT